MASDKIKPQVPPLSVWLLTVGFLALGAGVLAALWFAGFNVFEVLANFESGEPGLAVAMLGAGRSRQSDGHLRCPSSGFAGTNRLL